MSKLIIGCGYLGMRIAKTWIENGHDVFALTRLPANAHNFRSHKLQPIIGDVTEIDSLHALTQLPTVRTVLYAVGYDAAAGRSKREVYVTGLDNVLKSIHVPLEHFIYVSSTSVYGQTDGEWVDESSTCQPTRFNGRICLEAECSVWQKFSTGVIDSAGNANVLRLAGIYGPGRLLSRIESLQTRKVLRGNPNAWLNLIHVDDAAAAVLACEDRGRPGATYLVCDDRPLRRREYYETLASFVGAPVPTFSDPELSDENNFNKRCCNKKLRDELHMKLKHPTITNGLQDALRNVQ